MAFKVMKIDTEGALAFSTFPFVGQNALFLIVLIKNVVLIVAVLREGWTRFECCVFKWQTGECCGRDCPRGCRAPGG